MDIGIEKLIEMLKQKFWNTNTFAKTPAAANESVIQIVKSYFDENDLIIIPRVEYENLLGYKERDFLKDPEGPIY